MKDAVIIISIALGSILILGLVFFIVMYYATLKAHNKTFGFRFESDKRITFYTKEQFGLGFEELEVPMDDVVLKGGIYSYPNYKEDSIFVYAHGMWCGVRAYIQDIEFFCKKGYRVIALNHEGTDESTGSSIKGLSNSLRCLDATIKYIKNNEELKNKSIYVCGHSWGGFATLNIVKYHPDIKGIIAFAPFLSVRSCLYNSVPKGSGLVYPFFNIIEKKQCGEYAKANAIESLKDYKGNVVILHSKNDNFVNFEFNTKKLMNIYPNINYLIYENKYHNPHYTDEALELMLKFYKEIKTFKSEEDVALYVKNTDFNKMGELDLDVMNDAFNLLMK